MWSWGMVFCFNTYWLFLSLLLSWLSVHDLTHGSEQNPSASQLSLRQKKEHDRWTSFLSTWQTKKTLVFLSVLQTTHVFVSVGSMPPVRASASASASASACLSCFVSFASALVAVWGGDSWVAASVVAFFLVPFSFVG